MAEKRRGLGRGLGALIPSSAEPEESSNTGLSPSGSGRPVDLFFAAADDSRNQVGGAGPRRGAGINKEALRGPSKRTTTRGSVAKSAAEAVFEETPDTASGNAKAVGSTPGKSTRKAATRPAEAREGSGSTKSAATANKSTAKADRSAKQPVRRAAGTADPADSGLEPASSDVSRETSTGVAESAQLPEGLVQVPGATFAELPIDSIHPNRKQPRSVFDEDDMAELVHSIREIGVLQPIVVRPSAEGDPDHPYELVMGERRWRATREAGLEFVPAIIRSTQDVDLLRDALLENLHRSQLNPLEEAAAYQQLLDDFECSHEELADRIGRSRPQVTNTLRLMKLPPLVQRRLAAGVLSAGHARTLLGLGDPAEMEKLAQRIVAEGLSVRATEEIVSLGDGLKKPAKNAKPKLGARHERLDYLATSLSDRLDTNVKITLGARKGKVSIEFASVDDLNRIMGVLTPPNS
ncbi:ParB/RepB/Spo0J family partition protein [Arthrobacter sp. YD2]|uniref:ParB/RepB/Spo0J family partition protein n=1 Tax=Arthrobacter sp. YD2 TaxID=3058046 RepID=UPI0025B4FE4E|nr:ParB/RepB/Spo0J family partition protein [Arthrobacter sp. YD2]MDN3903094.1 ParB/RepB/Spo0J family partition protein [Arthrobacter sp. YD2]